MSEAEWNYNIYDKKLPAIIHLLNEADEYTHYPHAKGLLPSVIDLMWISTEFCDHLLTELLVDDTTRAGSNHCIIHVNLSIVPKYIVLPVIIRGSEEETSFLEEFSTSLADLACSYSELISINDLIEVTKSIFERANGLFNEYLHIPKVNHKSNLW